MLEAVLIAFVGSTLARASTMKNRNLRGMYAGLALFWFGCFLMAVSWRF